MTSISFTPSTYSTSISRIRNSRPRSRASSAPPQPGQPTRSISRSETTKSSSAVPAAKGSRHLFDHEPGTAGEGVPAEVVEIALDPLLPELVELADDEVNPQDPVHAACLGVGKNRFENAPCDRQLMHGSSPPSGPS